MEPVRPSAWPKSTLSVARLDVYGRRVRAERLLPRAHQLGGFFLIEAQDMDEACAFAARFPPARVAVVEIRPVQELQHSRDRRSLPN
jgi:hypothetical protein